MTNISMRQEEQLTQDWIDEAALSCRKANEKRAMENENAPVIAGGLIILHCPT